MLHRGRLPRRALLRSLRRGPRTRARLAGAAGRARARGLFPGHGSAATAAKDALARTLDWHERRAVEARELRQEGLSVRAIRRELFGLEGPLYWFTGGEFSKTNLVRALLRLPPP